MTTLMIHNCWIINEDLSIHLLKMHVTHFLFLVKMNLPQIMWSVLYFLLIWICHDSYDFPLFSLAVTNHHNIGTKSNMTLTITNQNENFLIISWIGWYNHNNIQDNAYIKKSTNFFFYPVFILIRVHSKVIKAWYTKSFTNSYYSPSMQCHTRLNIYKVHLSQESNKITPALEPFLSMGLQINIIYSNMKL